MILKRLLANEFGVFGEMCSDDGLFQCATLEHSYLDTASGSYGAKVPMGSYNCVLGTHQLEGMSSPFSTYEITGVPGHSGILFHSGNYNRDSSGCVLLGKQMDSSSDPKMIANSKMTFENFMKYLDGLSDFQLVVE